MGEAVGESNQECEANEGGAENGEDAINGHSNIPDGDEYIATGIECRMLSADAGLSNSETRKSRGEVVTTKLVKCLPSSDSSSTLFANSLSEQENGDSFSTVVAESSSITITSSLASCFRWVENVLDETSEHLPGGLASGAGVVSARRLAPLASCEVVTEERSGSEEEALGNSALGAAWTPEAVTKMDCLLVASSSMPQLCSMSLLSGHKVEQHHSSQPLLIIHLFSPPPDPSTKFFNPLMDSKELEFSGP
ncbi:unnamed protein product [Protopolystoma xenopodis]|uniref:Uncharacterized protein n=1 Tax=Protopolystoma xenopodis TaxID=117903 RepID=A0A3S5BBT7_9PLAT|nr:unnamed protein product [Protopolystoma xenopodis]